MFGDGEAPQRSRRTSRLQGIFRSWGAISGAVRTERAKDGAHKIKGRRGHPSTKSVRDRWGKPWLDVWPTAVPLAEGGPSPKVANRYTGMTREQAQEIFRAAEEETRIHRPRGRLRRVQKPARRGE
jgi:hypothetical protein